mgnify:CR=1 FL=1
MEGRSLKSLLNELESQYGLFQYARIDTHYPLNKRAKLMRYAQNNPPKYLLGSPIDKIQTFDGVKYSARNGCWLMLRGSGTEPVLRIYAEAPTRVGVEKLLRQGQSIADRIRK